MGLVKWQRHGCCSSVCGIAVQGVYSATRKDFFQAIEEAMISLCNSLELMALSDSSESAKDETLLLK